MSPQSVEEQNPLIREYSAYYEQNALTQRQGLYARYMKRGLDILCSAVGLVALSPVLAVIACIIKLTTPGPIFFRQVRIGRGGRQFRILKFRSMVADAGKNGLGITISGDSRVTGIGTFLRHYKFDELPQLWNVLRGDMSLVGPRPELPVYVARYTPEQLRVLSARPGITDPASIVYRFEEDLLRDQPHAEQFYCDNILPHKLSLNLKYITNVTLKNDLLLLLLTIKALSVR